MLPEPPGQQHAAEPETETLSLEQLHAPQGCRSLGRGQATGANWIGGLVGSGRRLRGRLQSKPGLGVPDNSFHLLGLYSSQSVPHLQPQLIHSAWRGRYFTGQRAKARRSGKDGRLGCPRAAHSHQRLFCRHTEPTPLAPRSPRPASLPRGLRCWVLGPGKFFLTTLPP